LKETVIDDYARARGFYYGVLSCNDLACAYRDELEKGLTATSSLAMLPSHIDAPRNTAAVNTTVVALDLGGTTLRAARIRFDPNGKPLIDAEHTAPTPGSTSRLNADAFFDAIATIAKPLFTAQDDQQDVSGIGFCFSYAMRITHDHDAIVEDLSKELDVPDLIGMPLACGLRTALKRHNIDPPPVVVLNDTTATLLTGSAVLADAGTGPVIGFVLGTGVNIATPETIIPKADYNEPNTPTIVVHEAGGLYTPRLGGLDAAFDATTATPGFHSLEKAMSGAYLGPLFLFALKDAERSGVLEAQRKDDLLALELLTTSEFSAFLTSPTTAKCPLTALFADDNDGRGRALRLGALISERAGLFAAAMLAGSITHLSAGRLADSTVRVAVDGSTFTRFSSLRKSLETRLHYALFRDGPCFYTMRPVAQASLLGAALAAATAGHNR
jgi:hexokinase